MMYDEKASDWNFAMAYFQRIDDSLKVCNRASMQNDFTGWLRGIEIFYREISSRFVHSYVDPHSKVVEDEYKKAESLLSKARNLVEVDKRVNVSYMLKRKSLEEVEMFLREIMRRRKMDLPSSNDPHRAMMGGHT